MNTCYNTLYTAGDSNAVSKFFDLMNEMSNIGEYFENLEKSVENIEDDLDLPCASQSPWIDTFDTDDNAISWEASGYPSLLAVYKLSKDFPDIAFMLNFENTEDEVAGCIAICDGNILKKHLVDFDGAIEILLDNYGNEIMSLKVGEKIEVGDGMVDVECTGEEETKDEIIKKFNVQFQCDQSPKIIVHVTKVDDDSISLDMDFMTVDWRDNLSYDYSDDDGNEHTSEGSYNGEMCVHSEKPWLDDFREQIAHGLLENKGIHENKEWFNCSIDTAVDAIKKASAGVENLSSRPPSNFIVQDGVATHIETGLMWLRFAHGQQWGNGNIIGDAKKFNWDEAMKVPGEFNKKGGYGGFTDWRVPNIEELKTLIDKVKGGDGNYIDADVFPENAWLFWSSSPSADDSSYAWDVLFSGGYSDSSLKSYVTYVRLVRG